MGKYFLPRRVSAKYSVFVLSHCLPSINCYFAKKSREKLSLFTYFSLCSDKNFASAKKLIPSNFIFPAVE